LEEGPFAEPIDSPFYFVLNLNESVPALLDRIGNVTGLKKFTLLASDRKMIGVADGRSVIVKSDGMVNEFLERQAFKKKVRLFVVHPSQHHRTAGSSNVHEPVLKIYN
jgi:hypothetical protein